MVPCKAAPELQGARSGARQSRNSTTEVITQRCTLARCGVTAANVSIAAVLQQSLHPQARPVKAIAVVGLAALAVDPVARQAMVTMTRCLTGIRWAFTSLC